MSDDADDDLLLELIARELRRDDPPPASLRERALAIPGSTPMDRALAELVEDLQPTRDSEAGWVFRAGSVTIDVVVEGDIVTVDVVGTEVSGVGIEFAGQPSVELVDDVAGWRGRLAQTGPARVVVDGDPPVATDWFTLA